MGLVFVLFDKLDEGRVEKLLKVVSGEQFGQIFITDSNKVRISNIVKSFTEECSSYNVVNGEYCEQ